MGAITISRKLSEEWLSVNRTHSSPNSSESRISKRARFSSMPQTSPGPVLSSYSTVSRLSRYPEVKPHLTREVHAPTRTGKFDFRPISTQVSRSRTSRNFEKEETGSDMGNLVSIYKKAKASALDALCHSHKGKKVLEVDTFSQKIAVSEDSSEEVEIIEHGRHSEVTDQTLQGSAEDVAEIHGLDAKATDGGLQHQHFTSSVVTELNYDNLKGAAENLIDSLSLESEASGKHVYEKLLDHVNSPGRTDTFRRLSHEIELYEKKKRHFDLLRDLHPKKEPIEDIPCEPFVPLTEEEEAEITNAFSASRKQLVLVSHENSNIVITGEIFQCLRLGEWLNDEVINLHIELLKEREKREPDRFLKCHFFNTFFYKKLISGKNGYDFKSLRRWTSQRKLGYGLIECDKIFVPIHKEIHWCLAIINKRDKKFQYLDSLKGRDNQVLRVLARYFVDEVKDKSGEDIDVTSWEREFVEDLPEQKNGSDCGMFMLKYIDFYSRGLGLCFNQEHMPYFRQRTAKEILRLKAD